MGIKRLSTFKFNEEAFDTKRKEEREHREFLSTYKEIKLFSIYLSTLKNSIESKSNLHKSDIHVMFFRHTL